MKNVFKILTVMFVALLAACGGGGGGGGSSSLTYDGVSTQATITADNASDLAAMAFYGSELNDMLPAVSSVQGDVVPAASSPNLVWDLSQMILDLPERIASSSSVNVSTALDLSEGGPECSVSGSVSQTFSMDPSSGDITAKLKFSSCNDGEGYIANGTMSMIMDAQLTSLLVDLDYFSMEFLAENEKITIDGVINVSLLAASDTLTMNLIARDDTSGEMLKLVNYEVVIMDMGSYEEMTVSGEVYRSDVGFVVLTTEVPIEVNYSTGEPVAGVYLIKGDLGTWAEVDFSLNPNGSYGEGDVVLGYFSI